MKSFGKRNFMQPMGRPKHALKVPCFFSFYVLGWGGKEKIFFISPNFPMCLHYVPFKFPMGFQYFPLTFSPYLFTFICLGKWCPPFTYIGGPKGRNCTVQNRAFCFGEFPLFYFFWINGLIKLARCPKKKLGRHLI